MAIEETFSSEEQPTDLRARRAAVLAGVGLVWATFMAALGLLLLAVLVVLAASAGVAWLLGARMPRPDLRNPIARVVPSAAGVAVRGGHAARRVAARFRVASRTAARAATTRRLPRLFSATRRAGGSASQRLGTAGRAVHGRLTAPAVSRKTVKRRRDPRVAEALASNSQGIALARAGRHAEAIDAFDTALALLADTGDRHHEGQVLANLGTVHRKVGGTDAARFCWSRALERLEPGTPESERTAELLGVR